MDPELIAYLDERFGSIDERFRETSQQIQGLREETSRQFQELREETSQQIQGLREETSQQIQGLREETSQQIQGLREETSQQIQGLRQETTQQFQGLREETTQQIQGLRKETSERFDKLEEQLRLTDVKVEGLYGKIQLVAEGVSMANERLDSYKQEVTRGFEDTNALIKNGYRDLDRRVQVLERRARISS